MTSAPLDHPVANSTDLAGRVVYIVDDEELFRSYIATLLGQAKINVVESANSAELLAHLNNRMPDCILLDYNLAAENGFSLHEQLRLRFANLPPVIMLSADESQKTAIRAFRLGFNDYLPKRNLRLDEVVSAIRRSIVNRDIETAKSETASHMREQAQIDEMTGVYTRGELDRKMAAASEVAKRPLKSAAVVMVCFAKYDAIAAQFGISVADQVLRTFANRLRSLVRPDDICGRYSNDVFCCVMDKAPTPEAVERRRRELEDGLAFDHNVAAARVSVSALTVAGVCDGKGETLGDIAERLALGFAAERQALASDEGLADWVRLPQAGTVQPSEGRGPERRRSVRRRVLKPGFIMIHDGDSMMTCTIRNLSDHGARIRLEGLLALPDQFRLRIGETGKEHRVRKCWHLNNEVGVEFLD